MLDAGIPVRDLDDPFARPCPYARRVGAINTIRAIEGRWMGANTDVEGLRHGGVRGSLHPS
jgi:hypothetical protein